MGRKAGERERAFPWGRPGRAPLFCLTLPPPRPRVPRSSTSTSACWARASRRTLADRSAGRGLVDAGRPARRVLGPAPAPSSSEEVPWEAPSSSALRRLVRGLGCEVEREKRGGKVEKRQSERESTHGALSSFPSGPLLADLAHAGHGQAPGLGACQAEKIKSEPAGGGRGRLREKPSGRPTASALWWR